MTRAAVIGAALIAIATAAYALEPPSTQLIFVMEELVVDSVPVTDARTFKGSLRYGAGPGTASMLDPVDGGSRVVPLEVPRQ